MNTSEKLKSLRVGKDYSLEYVGKYVGVSKSTVKRWEDGDIGGIGSDKLVLLAKLYGVTPHYLVDWEDEEGNLILYDKEEHDARKEELYNVLRSLPDAQKDALIDYARFLLTLPKRVLSDPHPSSDTDK